MCLFDTNRCSHCSMTWFWIPQPTLILRKVVSIPWAAESFAWLLAAISMSVIFILLVSFRNKPLEQWNSHITINALINVLSQTAQTALLIPVSSSISQLKWIWFRKRRPLNNVEHFDAASRQPLDSLALVWRHPRWSITSFIS